MGGCCGLAASFNSPAGSCIEPVQDISEPAKRGHSATLALAGLAGNGACVYAESHGSCCSMGANILLEPAQLGAFGGSGDMSASGEAGTRWRRLAGREEGVGGRSGLGGRGTLVSPGCAPKLHLQQAELRIDGMQQS